MMTLNFLNTFQRLKFFKDYYNHIHHPNYSRNVYSYKLKGLGHLNNGLDHSLKHPH